MDLLVFIFVVALATATGSGAQSTQRVSEIPSRSVAESLVPVPISGMEYQVWDYSRDGVSCQIVAPNTWKFSDVIVLTRACDASAPRA